MIKLKYPLIIIVISIFLYSCNSSSVGDVRQKNKEQVVSSWRVSEIITMDKDHPEIDKMIDSSLKRELVSSGFVIYFFPDSTYTELDGYSTTHGKWAFIGDQKIQFGKKTLTIDKLEEKKGNKFLTASILNPVENLHSVLKFVEDGKNLKDFKKDPFHKDQNYWRQKPSKKESNEEIRNRLLNYILHYASILKASLERDQSAVSFAHSMGLIQIFRGGIGRIPKNKIKKDWINCFYDEEDAMKAFYLFSSYLKRGVYKGGTTGNWVKDDYDILMTIYDNIQQKTEEENEKFKAD